MAQNVTLLEFDIMIMIIIKIMIMIMIMMFSVWHTLQTLPTGAQQRQRKTLRRWQGRMSDIGALQVQWCQTVCTCCDRYSDVGHWCVIEMQWCPKGCNGVTGTVMSHMLCYLTQYAIQLQRCNTWNAVTHCAALAKQVKCTDGWLFDDQIKNQYLIISPILSKHWKSP